MSKGQEKALLSAEQFFVSVIDQLGEETGEDLFEVRSREGIFCPALVMWLMLCQRLQDRRTLAGGLESIVDGSSDGVLERIDSKKVRLGNISMNPGGLCRARDRISLEKVCRAAHLISKLSLDRREKEGTGKRFGKNVYMVDGTMLNTARTKQNLKSYPSIRNQYREIYHPQLICLCLHELFSGVALSPAFGPYRGEKATSEHRLFPKLISTLPTSSLILGDINFGVLTVARATSEAGHEMLYRLNKGRAKAIAGDQILSGNQDVEVTWKPAKAFLKNHPDFPGDYELQGRVIRQKVKNPGCKAITLFFFTTSDVPAKDLVELYKERERIENDIRDLKHTLELQCIDATTPDMVHKEIVMGFAAYNLMRATLCAAAQMIGLAPRDISFSRACALTRIFGNKIRDATTTNERNDIIQRFLTALRQSKLPKRSKFRIEPRKIVTEKRKKYVKIKHSREEERQLLREQLAEDGYTQKRDRKHRNTYES